MKPNAAPRMPISGKPNFPKINAYSRKSPTIDCTTETMKGVVASPAPVRIEFVKKTKIIPKFNTIT